MHVRFNDRNAFPVFSSARALPVAALRREFDRLFGDLDRTPTFGAAAAPTVKFEDIGEAFRLSAELPGIAEKNIHIDVTAKALSIKAVRQAEVPEGYTAHRRERQSFSFARSYELPSPVDPEKVHASLKQGVLTLTLPKVAELQPRRVAVSANA